MEKYQEALATGMQLGASIDEVSTLDATTLGHILLRIEEFEADILKVLPGEKDLPRLFILVGDWFQTPPVRATPLYMTILNNYVLDKPSTPSSPEDIRVRARFFKTFKLFRLDVQYRSKDPQHSANLLAV
jgi:hypothetical protein